MSGYPGSGKSTLAKEISKNTDAVVVDHDIVKSALMNSMETFIDPKVAGKISYDIDWSLVEFHLSLGHNVILSDNKERDLRLRTRNRMISQVSEVSTDVRDILLTIENSKMKRPTATSHLIVDTARPLVTYIDEVTAYLNE